MRLAWFTPFSRSSAIGRFSQAVTNELSKHVEVELWVSSSVDLLPTSLRLVQYDPEIPIHEWPRTESYDFAIYNDEKQLGLHQIRLDFSGKTTSIPLSGDFLMNQFMRGHYQLILNTLNRQLPRAESRRRTGRAGFRESEHDAPICSKCALDTPAPDYAVRLLWFLDELRSLKPALEPLHRTATTLAELHVESDMEIVRSIAGMFADMFCRSVDEAPWNQGLSSGS
jgi:hypothetical protein